MANTIDLNLNVDTEQLKSFVKQLSSFTKLFNKSFKNFLPMGAILGEFEEHKITLAYLLTMGTFDISTPYKILYNTDSIQIRPKAIYKNNKGYYKKVDNKMVYFTTEVVNDIEDAIIRFKSYLTMEEIKNGK